MISSSVESMLNHFLLLAYFLVVYAVILNNILLFVFNKIVGNCLLDRTNWLTQISFTCGQDTGLEWQGTANSVQEN